MNKDSILDLFLNDILPSIATCELKVEDTVYNIRFNTAIYNNGDVKYIANIHNPELPTLIITKMEDFSHLLLQFVDEVMNANIKWCTPYISVSSKEAEIKYFLSLMWSNMTINDFINPEEYIKRCISFLKDETFKDLAVSSGPIEKLDNCYLEVSNIEEKSCYETPYAMRITIADHEGHRFVLPDVKYGIENVGDEKRAYIYTVQYDSKMKDENETEKKLRSKINRLLYKVDQDISKEELNKKMTTQGIEAVTEENIVDVTPSSLVSLTVALSLLAKEGITEVLAPSYLPH